MTIELLIHAIVRQTTILIAQLATSQGARAPLAQVANQVFLDLVRELERQDVDHQASASMFGMGLRAYQRKIQRLSESATEPGRSLWEAVLEHIRAQGLVSRDEIVDRFLQDEAAQVGAVLQDLSESQLVFSSGSGRHTTYRAATDAELKTLQQRRGTEGADELTVALMYREGPLTAKEIAARAQVSPIAVEPVIERLLASGRIEQLERDGEVRYRAGALVIPLGAPMGFEAAVLDHFKAMVTTIQCRLEAGRTMPEDQVGGSTYTLDVWDDHPLAAEVYGTLGHIRALLSQLRARVNEVNTAAPRPNNHTRVVIYAGQSVLREEGEAPTE